MGGTSTDVGLIEDGVPQVSGELELEYAHADPRADGRRAHDRRRRRLDRLGRCGRHAAGRPGERRRHGRGRSATAAAAREPTITDANLVLGRLNPDRAARRRPSGDARPCARRSSRTRSASRSASTPMRRPPPSCASPTTAWPARCAWCRCRAATIRATSRCSPSAAPGRCTPRRWRASSAIPTVLVPARPGITNALGCVVADLRHDYVRTVNKPLVGARRCRRSRGIYAEQTAERRRDDRSARACRCASCAACCSADMQFQGQSHILSVGVDRADIGVEGLRKAFAAAYWPPLRHRAGGDPAGAGQPPHRGDRRAAGDLARGARGRPSARRRLTAAQVGERPRLVRRRLARRRRSMRASKLPRRRARSRGRRSSSSSIARPSSSRATGSSRTSLAIC